jgi:hypothetical protein
MIESRPTAPNLIKGIYEPEDDAHPTLNFIFPNYVFFFAILFTCVCKHICYDKTDNYELPNKHIIVQVVNLCEF